MFSALRTFTLLGLAFHGLFVDENESGLLYSGASSLFRSFGSSLEVLYFL